MTSGLKLSDQKTDFFVLRALMHWPRPGGYLFVGNANHIRFTKTVNKGNKVLYQIHHDFRRFIDGEYSGKTEIVIQFDLEDVGDYV